MGKEILVSAAEKNGSDGKPARVVRMAVLTDGELTDYAVSPAGPSGCAGNIYKGVVTNIFPGTQSCFVDIGQDKNAVMYASDIALTGGGQYKRPIETLLLTGQKIVVQILRAAAGDKGAHVTTKLALPGKYAVLLPRAAACSVSRKITDEKELQRLREIAKKHRPPECGLIIRTEAEGASEEQIASDVAVLIERLASMRRSEAGGKIPDCIHIESDIYRDIFFRALEDGISRVIVDDKVSYRELLGRASAGNPDISYKIQHYRDPWPIFAFYGVQNDVDNLQSRRIWLKCGAYIVVEHTEAMTVVDVNTGKYSGGGNRRETFLRVNLEAVAETARQMRLRDIGGIVIVDALKMDSAADNKAILDALEAELKKDRQKTAVAGFTKLGLIEMTRKKIGAGLLNPQDEPWY